MLRLELGKGDFDIRFFLVNDKGEETQLDTSALFLSRIKMVIDADSHRTLTLETNRFTFSGEFVDSTVEIDKLITAVEGISNKATENGG